MVVYSLPVSKIQLFNVAVQFAVDALFVWAAGSWNVLWYFIMSSFLAGSLHPCAGHFIAEHVSRSLLDLMRIVFILTTHAFSTSLKTQNPHHQKPLLPPTSSLLRLIATTDPLTSSHTMLAYTTSTMIFLLSHGQDCGS